MQSIQHNLLSSLTVSWKSWRKGVRQWVRLYGRPRFDPQNLMLSSEPTRVIPDVQVQVLTLSTAGYSVPPPPIGVGEKRRE